MNKSAQPTSGATDGGDQTDESSGEPFRSSAITIQRKMLIAGTAALVLVVSVLTAVIVIVAWSFSAHDEVPALEKTVAKLTKEKQVAQKRYDDLLLAHSKLIAERRCEAPDGLDDCLAAGLTRPEQFAEADRQTLEARAVMLQPHSLRKNRRMAGTEAVAETAARPAEASPGEPARAPSAANGKVSLGEFVEELRKIPGVAVDGGQPVKPGRAAENPKGRKAPAKPES
jgi:hypothetical protein